MSRGRVARRGVGDRFWRLEGEETENLIKEVRIRPSLWDDRNEDFKHPKVTARLWEEVGEALNMPGDELRKKWKNLKDKYRKTLQDQMIRKQQTKDPPPKPWKYGHLLEFTKESLLPSVVQAVAIYGEGGLVDDGGESQEPYQMPRHEGPLDALGAHGEEPMPEEPPRKPLRSAASLGMQRRREAESEFDQSAREFEIHQNQKRRFTEIDYDQPPKVKFIRQEPEQHSPCPQMPMQVHMQVPQAKESKIDDDDYMFLMSLHPFLKPLTAFEKLELRSRMLSQVMETYRQHQQRLNDDPSQQMICDAVQLEPNTLIHYDLPE